ncbi:MAG: ABC transporter permease [Pirellulales bacterium]|nr:ABC transporter permease [Pirellulales bacterium]
MNPRRVRAVARKEFLHVVRDPLSLLMALATPVLLLTLFGFALTLDVDNIPLAVWDQSNTPRSRELISRFDGSRYFSLGMKVDNYWDLVRAIDSGQAMMGLVMPSDFAELIEAGRDAPVQLIVDGSDSNTATIAIGYAGVVAEIYALDLTIEQNQRRGGPSLNSERFELQQSFPSEKNVALPAVQGVKIPLDVRPRVWFNEELESRNFIIPGLIAVIMMVIAAMLTSLTVAREWERGTMEQLISTPIKPGELILGKLAPYFVIGICDVLLAVLMAEFVFHVPLRGNVALLFGMSAVFLVGALAMGMTVSIVTRSQLLSCQVAVVATFLPAFLLSGFIFTIANMPPVIRAITYIVPARYFVAILKGNYLKGDGLEILGTQAVLLAVYAVVMVLLARVRLKKKLA